MKLSQQERILNYLHEFKSITTLDAFKDLGITKLTTRISEMRRKGIEIIGKPEVVENRYGDKCHIYRYSLKETPNKTK